MENIKAIVNAGDGLNGLTVLTKKCSVNGYEQIASVINTFVMGDEYSPEMPVPKGVVLVKKDHLTDFNMNVEEERQQEEQDQCDIFGDLMYVKNVSFNDLEVSLIAYEAGFLVTALSVENGNRSLINTKFYDCPSDFLDDNTEENNDDFVKAQVVKSVFNNIDSYDDLARWIADFIVDESELENYEKFEKPESAKLDIFENAWELKDNSATKES